MKSLCLALCVGFLTLLASVGAWGTEWIQTFTGSEHGALLDLTATPDGNVLAVGATHHTHTPTRTGDALLMKVSLAGEILWERTWGGSEFEQAWAVERADEGGYYVFGETASFGAGDRDFFLLKITEGGEEVWSRTYGSAQREWPFGLLRLENGDLLMYGETISNVEAQYAVRVSPMGETLWEHLLGETENQFITGALETENGDLILCAAVGEDSALLRLDSSGRILRFVRHELDGQQYPTAILPTLDGGFLLAGFYRGEASNGRADVWLARCASSGELETWRSFGSESTDDYALSLARLTNGTALIGGFGSGLPIWCVADDGTLLWESRPASGRIHGAFGLLELPDADLLISGLAVLTNGRLCDAVLLRTDPQGHIAD